MDKNFEKAVDLASESIKQQITIAAAIIGGTIAFAGNLKEAEVQAIWHKLPPALTMFGLVVLFGVIALQSLAWELKENADPFKAFLVRYCGALQNILFVGGFVALVRIVISS